MQNSLCKYFYWRIKIKYNRSTCPKSNKQFQVTTYTQFSLTLILAAFTAQTLFWAQVAAGGEGGEEGVTSYMKQFRDMLLAQVYFSSLRLYDTPQPLYNTTVGVHSKNRVS